MTIFTSPKSGHPLQVDRIRRKRPPQGAQYLVQGRQAVHVRRIDIRTLLQEPEHFVLITRRARCQKHTTRREVDFPLFLLRMRRFPVRIRLFPPLQLFGPFEKGRTRPVLYRHDYLTPLPVTITITLITNEFFLCLTEGAVSKTKFRRWRHLHSRTSTSKGLPQNARLINLEFMREYEKRWGG